ncbi:MAG: ankyrin repeat domain-containing protein [Planctomycetota bacterium]|jgi:ankyrin repeat protein
MNSSTLISRRQHYLYVLLFSILACVFIAEFIGGFWPLYFRSGKCKCAWHDIYWNVSFIFFGAIGLVWGILFSPVLNRLMLVANAKPEDTQVPLSLIARMGKTVYGWRIIFPLIITAAVYMGGDYIIHSFRTHKSYEKGPPVIFCIVKRGDVFDARKEINRGADVNEIWYDILPLHVAVGMDNLEISELLIDGGADINASIISFAYTPLQTAIKNNYIEMARLLVEKGASFKELTDFYSSFSLAVSWGRFEIAEMLLKKGANINRIQDDGRTPLHLAVIGKNLKGVVFLLEHGADINLKDSEGYTPFLRAVMNGKTDIVRVLLEKGADINRIDFRGMSPLHWAVASGKIKIVRFMIKNGANVNAYYEYGATPLDVAISLQKNSGDRQEIIELIKKKGGKNGKGPKRGLRPW